MNKKLIIVNGTMGVGKTVTCDSLFKKLNKSAWLDGDWCWNINPFIVNDENKNMVEKNIVYILKNYLTNSNIENVIFSWVIHENYIFDLILKPLLEHNFELYKISLVCNKNVLENRIKKRDRSADYIKKSTGRLKLYENQNTIKIDNSKLSVEQVIDEILYIIMR